jgi:hypothetical protein
MDYVGSWGRHHVRPLIIGSPIRDTAIQGFLGSACTIDFHA